MEAEFSKLTGKPFSLVPSTAVFYQSTGVKNSYNTLLNGVRAGHKLILVTGDQGSGKTLYAQKLETDLKAEPTCCCISPPNTIFSQKEMQTHLCEQLTLDIESDQNQDASKALHRFLRDGVNPIKSVVIIIDEARNLSAEIINGLVMLLETEPKARRIFQLVLLAGYGQKLQVEPQELASFKKRISLQCDIAPFQVDQIAGYIKYQLEVAGEDYTQHFMADACERIFFYTNGNVRAINQLCDQILTQAEIDYVNVITPELVDTAQRQIVSQENQETHTLPTDKTVQNTDLEKKPLAVGPQLTTKEYKEAALDRREQQNIDRRGPGGIPILTHIRKPSINFLSRLSRNQGVALIVMFSVFGLLAVQLLYQKKSIEGLEKKLVVLNDKLTKNIGLKSVGFQEEQDSLLMTPPIEHPVFDEQANDKANNQSSNQPYDQLDIEQLFNVAETQISDNNLTGPEGDNALETYQHILELEPENQRVQKSLAKLKQDFIRWAIDSEKEKKLDWALSQYKRALKIDPEDKDITKKITELRKRITSGDSGEILSAALENAKAGNTSDLAELIDQDISPDSRDESGNTLLMLASDRGHIDTVELLLARKANVNLTNNNDDTALINAISGNHQAISKLLIKNQAKINATNNQGVTALMSAATKGYTSLITLLGEAGARSELRTSDGKTPLAAAAQKGQRDAVSLLIKQGAKIDSRDNESWTPLMHAVKSNHINVVQLLLSNKADVNSMNREQNTPLMLAAETGYESIAKMLLDQGADKSTKNAKGIKAIDLAKQNQHGSLVALLKQSSRRKVGHNILRN